jgi:hypothetical protein
MEAIDNNQFIIIGKYYISKYIMMTEPAKLYVTNSETKQTNIYYSYQVFELLKNECLDAEPLHCYFDRINGVTKEYRIRMIESYNQFEERKKWNKKIKILKLENKNIKMTFKSCIINILYY